MLGSSSTIRTFATLNSPQLCATVRGSGRCRRERKQNRKTTSLSDFAFDRDGPVMSFHNVLDERQAQAATLHVMNKPVTDPVELLKNLCLLSAGDSNAVIGYFNKQFAV